MRECCCDLCVEEEEEDCRETERKFNEVVEVCLDISECPKKEPHPLWGRPIEKMENNMFDVALPTETERQRAHLIRRSWNIKQEKIYAARDHFHLDDDDYPRTPAEYVERIKAGKFVLRKADDTDDEGGEIFYNSPPRYIVFRDPANPADHKGFNAFSDKVHEARVKLEDKITVSDPVDGLTLLEAFEATDFLAN